MKWRVRNILILFTQMPLYKSLKYKVEPLRHTSQVTNQRIYGEVK